MKKSEKKEESAQNVADKVNKATEKIIGTGNYQSLRSRSSTWFECKVRYEKTREDGSEKMTTEHYTVDALSFTEAEAKIIEEMAVYVSGELRVDNINRAAYGEISSPTSAMMISGSRLVLPSLPLMRRVKRRNVPTLPISYRQRV